MRDRLIELIDGAEDLPICQTYEGFADYLISNGVIVPPFKVGDTVYSYSGDFGVILPYIVENLTIAYLEKDKLCYTYEANCHNEDELLDSIDFDIDDIGKTVFFSREESEAKLKGGKG